MSAVLPPWLLDAGPAVAAQRLGEQAVREKVKGDCRRYWLRVADGKWDELWLGRTVQQSSSTSGRASSRSPRSCAGCDPMDAYLDILAGEGEHLTGAGMFGVVKDEAHLRQMLTHPLYAAEADARSAPLRGPWRSG